MGLSDRILKEVKKSVLISVSGRRWKRRCDISAAREKLFQAQKSTRTTRDRGVATSVWTENFGGAEVRMEVTFGEVEENEFCFRCFGLLLAAGRNVKHSDMHLLDMVSNEWFSCQLIVNVVSLFSNRWDVVMTIAHTLSKRSGTRTVRNSKYSILKRLRIPVCS